MAEMTAHCSRSTCQPWVTAQGDRCKLYILDPWESASEQSEFDHVRGC